MEFLSLSRRRSSSRNVPQRRWARRNVCRPQDTDSQKTLNVESGILGLGIRNTAVGNRNPTKDCNPNPSSTDKDWNEVLGIRNLLHGIQDLKMSWGPLQGANRPLASSKNPHFQNEARCTTFLVKMSFICMRMKNDFHIKGWAPTLVLKQRPGGTGKWPIQLLKTSPEIERFNMMNWWIIVETGTSLKALFKILECTR